MAWDIFPEWQPSPRDLLEGMICNISGRETPWQIYEMYDHFSVGTVERLFQTLGLRWNVLTAEDASNAVNGRQLRFFAEDLDFAARFRRRHGIYIEPKEVGFVPGNETIRRAGIRFGEIREFYAKHGVPKFYYDMGYMCWKEQADFYESPEWKDRASAQRYMAGYRCEICRSHNKPLHVHHRTPLVSAFHHNFGLCWHYWKLEVLCEDCHQRQHANTVRGSAAYQFVHVEPEQVEEERGYFRKMRHLHDQWRTCQYCNHIGYFDKIQDIDFGMGIS